MKYQIYKLTVKSDDEFRNNHINELIRSFEEYMNFVSGKIIGNNWQRKTYLHPTALLIPDLSKISRFYDGKGFDETDRVLNLHLHGYLVVPVGNLKQQLRLRKALPSAEKTHRIPGYHAFRVWTEKYEFDGRKYDGYIAKSFRRLSNFGNGAFFGYLRAPMLHESFLMNDMTETSLEVLCRVAGVELSQDQKALI